MSKIKLGVIFGGMSTENEVSVKSAKSVLKNLDKNKYNIFPIYISKEGVWYLCDSQEEKQTIGDIFKFLKNLDIVFPVLHGLYGEDGTIQGLLEMLKIPYVGCKVLASSIGMDKVYSKIIFEKANINQAKYIYIRKNNENYIYIDEEFNEQILTLQQIAELIENKIQFPVFIKPSNSGSSVGINKAKNRKELEYYIEIASNYDSKILIEQALIGKEVECAVLGNEDVVSSCVGEIIPADEFYSYDAKYNNNKSQTLIPAKIDTETSKKIQQLSIKAFKAIDGKGLARVDFFIEENTNKIYINEINTMPGFTNISMYPKLFDAVGISYKSLLDKLIELAKN